MPTRVFPLVFLIAFPRHSQRPSNNLTFGGSGNDSINATTVDSAGNIYLVGTTASFDFPLRNAFQAANSGTELIYSVNAGATWTPLANPLVITPRGVGPWPAHPEPLRALGPRPSVHN